MKVLLVDLLYIGDLLFTTPAIRVLASACPGAEIDVLVNHRSQQVVQHHPLLRRVIGVDTSPKMNLPGPFLSLLRRLRRERYDLACCFHGGNERAALLTGFSGAKLRGGYVKRELRFLFTRELAIPVNDLIVLAPKHVTEIYIDVLAKCGVPRSPHRGLEMWPGEEAERKAELIWEQAGLAAKSPVIGINTGGTFPTKLWTVEGFARLCDLLTADGLTPVIFGGPMDQQRSEAIRALATSKPLSLAGQTDLLELSALVRKCAVFVSGDTGPMHIAASQHVPIVAVFSRTLRQVYGPLGTEHLVVTGDVPCLECNKRFCDDMRCMTELPAERVRDGVHQLLATVSH